MDIQRRGQDQPLQSPFWLVWGMQDGNGVLLISALLFLALFLRLWPQSFTSMDESSYINMASVLRHGTVYPDVAGVSVVTAYPFAGHLICKYPLGMPTLLAAFSFMGWRFTFGVNLIVHLLTFLLVIRLLRRLNVPAQFALLYLLYPTAVLYSRTLMADPVSGLLLAFAFDQYLSRRALAVGALIGFAVTVRTGNVLALPVFLAAWLIECEDARHDLGHRVRHAAAMLAGSAPFLLLAAYYARVIAGGQMAQHTGNFSASYFPHMFPAYVLGLLLLYPGMLLGPALYRGRGRVVVGGLCYGFLLLYSFWYYRDQGGSWAETLVVGQRYFLAALPLWIIAYSIVCWSLLRRISPRRQSLFAAVTVFAFFCVAGGISVRHARYTAQLADVRTKLLAIVSPRDVLICNVQVAKLFYPGAPKNDLLVVGNQLPATGLNTARDTCRFALEHPGARVYLAAWTRAGRTDDQPSAASVSMLAHLLGARPVTEDTRKGLPPEVTLFQTSAVAPELH